MLNISLKETIRYLRQKDYENLASLLEEVWESHPDKDHQHYDMWREQLAVNLPVLYIASICLHNYIESHGIKNIRKLISKDRAEFLVFSADGSPIEMLNYDIIGTCNDYNKYGPVRSPLEYDVSDVQGYHNCANLFIKLLKRQSSIDDNHSEKSMRNVINLLFKPALDKLPVISDWIKPERKHEDISSH